MITKNEKSEKLELNVELVNELPLCKEGKKGMKKLVEAMGYKFSSEKTKPKMEVGQVWSYDYPSPAFYYLVLSLNEKGGKRGSIMYLVNNRVITTDTEYREKHEKFIAKNLEEHFEQRRGNHE